MKPRGPGLLSHLLLLWGVRAKVARNGFGRGLAGFPALLGLVALTAVALVVARGTYALLTHPAVTDDPPLLVFLVLLVGFLSSTLWVLWPIVTATVDDAAELSRFALFPVSGERLFAASLLASLIEPRVLPLWGAMSGTAAALVHQGASVWIAVLATLSLALCSAVWGRAGLHALLDVMRSRRSAEAMGGGLLLLLFGAAFVPPPDLSWLTNFTAGTPQVDSKLLAGATFLFTIFPTGGWAWSMLSAAHGSTLGALGFLLWLGAATALGASIAWLLLSRFHRHAGRALPQQGAESRTKKAFSGRTTLAVLAERELRDLLLNPRVRVMAALPFFLLILVKLVGGRELAAAALGTQADAWLLGGIASYGALVLGGGLTQNAFGYDAHGAALLLASPVEPGELLRAKNLVHGGAALLLSLGLCAFYSVWVAAPQPWVLAFIAGVIPWQIAWLTSVGNLLSVLAPVRFSSSLRKRDRPPPSVVATGLAAAIVAVLPGSIVLRTFAPEAPPSWAPLALMLLAGLGLRLRHFSEKLAVRLLDGRRPELLRALTRP